MNSDSIHNEIYNAYLERKTVVIDSRKVEKGCIYIAIKGERFDGNDFVEECLQKGALAVTSSDKFKYDPQCFYVSDTLEALQILAKNHRHALNSKIIAIAGSNGKTTTKELAAHVLSRRYKTFATPGNLNNHIGLPLSLLMMDESHEFGIIELGANHQGENALLCEICEPDYGLITNLGKDHLEGFGGEEGVAKANLELFDYLSSHGGTAFINADEPRLLAYDKPFKSIIYEHEVRTRANYNGEILIKYPFLRCEIRDVENNVSFTSETKLFGSFNIFNVLAASVIGFYFGVEAEHIKEAIEGYIPANMRSQIIEKDGLTFILDAYNANPSSMIPAIKDFAHYPAIKRVLILGDMFELGDQSFKEHQNAIDIIQENREQFDLVLLVGAEFFKHKDSIKAMFFLSTEGLKEWFKLQEWEEGTAFYLKGSRGMKLEGVL